MQRHISWSYPICRQRVSPALIKSVSQRLVRSRFFLEGSRKYVPFRAMEMSACCPWVTCDSLAESSHNFPVRAWHCYGSICLVTLREKLFKNWVLLLWAIAPSDLAFCSATVKREDWAETTAPFSPLWPFSVQSPCISSPLLPRGSGYRVTAGATKCCSRVGVVQRPLCGVVFLGDLHI